MLPPPPAGATGVLTTRRGLDMGSKLAFAVDSEVGRLEAVIVHRPGREMANMTPDAVQKALYSDILNLAVAGQEYDEFLGVLRRRARVMEVGDLLAGILADEVVREPLVRRLCAAEGAGPVADELLVLAPAELARLLIEGVPLRKDNLSRFLSRERYSLPPLHNFFFTRDSGMVLGRDALVGSMASPVRGREARLMEAIFRHHPDFEARTVNLRRYGVDLAGVAIEGGDVLVAAPGVLVVGMGARTTRQAIDLLIEHFRRSGATQHILVQELPLTPESFIHLDMVFTLLDRATCLAFEPVVMQRHHFDTVHIHIEGGRVVSIREEDNLPAALAGLGLEMEVLSCGGRADEWVQEREQWHSGANFFALGPGQVMGYSRNEATIDELARAGFAVVTAAEVADGRVDLDRAGRCVITVSGSELARGGGGCRCMTMPVRRAPL